MQKTGVALGLTLFLGAGTWLSAAPAIGPVAVTPQTVLIGRPTVLKATAVIQDPALIPTSVNLQQIDEAGKILAIVGNLNDSGLNGDLVAGDGVFSIQWSVEPVALGQLRYQVSAGFRGLLRRVASSPMTLYAQVQLAVEPDSVHQTVQRVTPEGGTVVADAADGTKFILSIPEDALLEPQDISMTPIRSIPNLPFSGGFRYGVKLMPEGLRLLHSATLEIRPAGALDYRHLIGFGYDGAGSALRLALLRREGTSVFMVVSHFSGNGIGEGSADSVSQAAAAAINEAASYLESQIAAAIAAEGRLNPDGGWGWDPGQYESAIENLFLDWYNAAVLPALMSAVDCGQDGCETFPESLTEAWYSFERWSSDMQMLGLGQDGVLGAVREDYLATFEEQLAAVFVLQDFRCEATTDPEAKAAAFEALLNFGSLLEAMVEWDPPSLYTVCGGTYTLDPVLQVDFTNLSLEVGESQQLTVTATDEHGETVANPDVLWTTPCLPTFEPWQCNIISFDPTTMTVRGVNPSWTWLAGSWRGAWVSVSVKVKVERWAGTATQTTTFSNGSTCRFQLDVWAFRTGSWANVRFEYRYLGGVCSNGQTFGGADTIHTFSFVVSDGAIVQANVGSVIGTANDNEMNGTLVWRFFGDGWWREEVTPFSLSRVRQ